MKSDDVKREIDRMTMNKRIKELAEQAGFVLWQDEPWNPGDVIDWSCRYDDELKKFAELIVAECANELIKWKNEPFPYDPEFGAKLISNILIGAEIHSDKGYTIGTVEESEKFAKSRRKPFGKNE